MSSNLLTNTASKQVTASFVECVEAVVCPENTTSPLLVYEVIPLAALAHPSNLHFSYPDPPFIISNPVTSPVPISTDAVAEGGD